jgi:hypothetical protein
MLALPLNTLSYRRIVMSNEPVDGMEGPDELEEQQEQQLDTPHPKIIYRVRTD